MARKIDYTDFVLDLEGHYQKKIDTQLDYMTENLSFYEEHRYKKEIELYELISNAINLNKHYAIQYLIEKVNTSLGTQVPITLYLRQYDKFNVTSISDVGADGGELLVFVSQHFFNNLNEDEQIAIIGHEVAHQILKHYEYPLKELLSYHFHIEEINGLKSYLLYWSMACEITADIFGLISNDFNFKAYSTAIIKHFTGLNDSSNSMFNLSPVVNLVIDQYNQFAEDPLYTGKISTHPLTQLRVKIINSVTKTRLVKSYGNTLGSGIIEEYKKEYNDVVNALIEKIYPEILPFPIKASKALTPLAFAVALADGNIDHNEVKAIKRILNDPPEFNSYVDIINADTVNSYKDKVTNLTHEAVNLARQNEYSKQEIVPLVRSLLSIAASDDEIVKEELDVIHDFASQFGFTKQDIIIILKTHHQIHF